MTYALHTLTALFGRLYQHLGKPQKLAVALTSTLLYSALCTAGNSTGGAIGFNLYPYLSDVDDDSVFTLAAASGLPHGLSYFGFVNFYNNDDDSPLKETVSYYTEQNLRWRPAKETPWELTFQANLRSGDDNDRYRLGARLHLNEIGLIGPLLQAIHVKWAINLHALQFDQDPAHAWQIEHSYSATFPYLSERLSLSGFIDHNRNETLPASLPKNPIVSETQLNYRLIDELYLIAEYRLNEYRRRDVNNLALGVEYKIRW